MNLKCTAVCQVTINTVGSNASATYQLDSGASTLPPGAVTVEPDGAITVFMTRFDPTDTLDFELRFGSPPGCTIDPGSSEFVQKPGIPAPGSDPDGTRNFPKRTAPNGGAKYRFNNLRLLEASWKHSYVVRIRGQRYDIDPDVTNTNEDRKDLRLSRKKRPASRRRR